MIVFLKDVCAIVPGRSWIFIFYSILKPPDSKWTDTENVPNSFKQDGAYKSMNSFWEGYGSAGYPGFYVSSVK